MVWFQLPVELWDIVGDYIFSDLRQTTNGSIEVVLKPAQFYNLYFEEGLTFMTPFSGRECVLT